MNDTQTVRRISWSPFALRGGSSRLATWSLSVPCRWLVAAVMLSAAASGMAAPVVTTVQGKLAGNPIGQGGGAFKGVPFAAPPVGGLRWQAPQPPRRWTGVRPAQRFGHSCLQIDGGWNHDAAADSSEDCLYLNVYTPKLQVNAGLPVMVWIHGGAFSGGSGSQEIYQAEPIVRRGVVLVTINYRLNVFGFLAHPGLHGAAAANFGIADQIAALRWVRANIAAFGGDPAKVTIFGQSAGGMSVMALMSSPEAKGLFGKAIIESGAMLKMPWPSLAAARQRGSQFAGGLSLARLRAMPADRLLDRFRMAAEAGKAAIGFGPVVDGRILPSDAATTFARHAEAKVPLLIGSNARESIAAPDQMDLASAIRGLYGPLADRASALYRDAPTDEVLGSPANQFMTDTGFRCSTVVAAKRHAATGAPTWQYQFEQPLPGQEMLGAQHSFELPYVFGSLPAPGKILGGAYTPADRQLSDLIIAYWTNFAKRGDPNDATLPRWPGVGPVRQAYVRFSTRFADGVGSAEGLRRPQCAMFEESLG